MIFDENIEEVFSKEVEKCVLRNGGDYIDSVLEVCEKYNMEPQLAAKFLSDAIAIDAAKHPEEMVFRTV